MRPFMRQPEGFWTAEVNRIVANGPATAAYQQAQWELVEHKIDFEGFAEMMERNMPRAMAQEFERLINTEREERLAQEMSLSHQLAAFTFGSTWGAGAPTPRGRGRDPDRGTRGGWIQQARPRAGAEPAGSTSV